MSYRNPQQFVDTQSAQHISRMQQQITGAFASFAQNYVEKNKANKLKIANYRDDLRKNNDTAANAIENFQGDVPSLNLEGINSQLDTHYELLKKDPSELTQEDRNLIRHVNNLPNILTDLITNIESGREDHLKSYEATGIEGGYPSDKLDLSDMARNVMFRVPGAEGRMELNFGMSKDRSTVGVDIYTPKYDDEGKKIEGEFEKVTLYPSQFDKQIEGTKIPTVTKDITEPFMKEYAAKANTLDYWQQGNGIRKTFTVNGKTTTYFTPNRDQIKENLLGVIDAGIAAYDDDELVAYNNSILGVKPLKYGEKVSQEQKAEMIENIADNLMKDPRFQKQYIADKTGDNDKGSTELNLGELDTQSTVSYLINEIENVESQTSLDDYPKGAVQFGASKGTILGYEFVDRPDDKEDVGKLGKVRIDISYGSGATQGVDSEVVDFSKPKERARFVEALIKAGSYGGKDKESMLNLVRSSYGLNDFNSDGVFIP
jgi:hypothetical protein